jgi:hypothetical protein
VQEEAMAELAAWISKTLTFGGVGIWSLVGLVLVALIRQKPIMQKLNDAREGNLLKERAADMRGMRRRIVQLEAEQRVDRHALANLEQCLDTLLMMIEISPERAQEAAKKVRAMREEQKANMASEKAAVMAATVQAEANHDAPAPTYRDLPDTPAE